MELRRSELQEAEPCDVSRDEPARFLRELRQLRTEAGLGYVELAARAHYPGDVIRTAEAGPSLPSLPVLSAFVRGCGGTPAEWEERWRSLTRSPASPLLPFRSAGDSDAATAGARVGAATSVADAHDPGIIMAALSRVADSIAADSPAAEAFTGSGTADGLMSVPDTTAALDTPPSATPGEGWPSAADPEDLPSDTAAPEAAAAADPEDAGRPADTFAALAAGPRRSPPPRAAIAAVIVAVCLVAIMVALFA